jgi:hypothetical protein
MEIELAKKYISVLRREHLNLIKKINKLNRPASKNVFVNLFNKIYFIKKLRQKRLNKYIELFKNYNELRRAFTKNIYETHKAANPTLNKEVIMNKVRSDIEKTKGDTYYSLLEKTEVEKIKKNIVDIIIKKRSWVKDSNKNEFNSTQLEPKTRVNSRKHNISFNGSEIHSIIDYLNGSPTDGKYGLDSLYYLDGGKNVNVNTKELNVEDILQKMAEYPTRRKDSTESTNESESTNSKHSDFEYFNHTNTTKSSNQKTNSPQEFSLISFTNILPNQTKNSINPLYNQDVPKPTTDSNTQPASSKAKKKLKPSTTDPNSTTHSSSKKKQIRRNP